MILYFGILILFFLSLVLLVSIETGIGIGGSFIVVIVGSIILFTFFCIVIHVSTTPRSYKPKKSTEQEAPVSVITEEYERQRLEYNKQRFPEYYKDK